MAKEQLAEEQVMQEAWDLVLSLAYSSLQHCDNTGFSDEDWSRIKERAYEIIKELRETLEILFNG